MFRPDAPQPLGLGLPLSERLRLLSLPLPATPLAGRLVVALGAPGAEAVAAAGVGAEFGRGLLFSALTAFLRHSASFLPPREDRERAVSLFPGLTDARLRMAITRACRRGGIPHFSPHSLRRRCGALHYKRTGSLAEVAELLGRLEAGCRSGHARNGRRVRARCVHGIPNGAPRKLLRAVVARLLRRKP